MRVLPHLAVLAVLSGGAGGCSGGTWALEPFPDGGAPTGSTQLVGVWGSGSDDVWAVGRLDAQVGAYQVPHGVALHWDGDSWSVALTTENQDSFRGVGGSGRDDAWIVASESVLHWDGVAWSPGEADLRISTLWVIGRDDVVAAGADEPPATTSRLLHWDGTVWATLASGITEPIIGLWASGSDDVWAIGRNPWTGEETCPSEVFHFDGLTVTCQDVPFTASGGLWGSGPADVWIGATDGFWRWDGATFAPGAERALAIHGPLGMAGRNGHDVWAVYYSPYDGSAGVTSVFHWDGAAWSAQPTPAAQPLLAVWVSAGGQVWAVGDEGTILRRAP